MLSLANANQNEAFGFVSVKLAEGSTFGCAMPMILPMATQDFEKIRRELEAEIQRKETARMIWKVTAITLFAMVAWLSAELLNRVL